uniref:Uncharacterized protein n=1 Tax=Steinernema glaseri TaxID=37863 RepID=A0A1I8A3R4_9BILA
MTDVQGQQQHLLCAEDPNGFSSGTRPPALGGRSPQSSFDSNGTWAIQEKQTIILYFLGSQPPYLGFSSGTRPPALGGRSPQSSFDSNGDVGQISVNWMRVNGTIAPFKALLTSTTSNADKQTPPAQKASVTTSALSEFLFTQHHQRALF